MGIVAGINGVRWLAPSAAPVFNCALSFASELADPLRWQDKLITSARGIATAKSFSFIMFAIFMMLEIDVREAACALRETALSDLRSPA